MLRAAGSEVRVESTNARGRAPRANVVFELTSIPDPLQHVSLRVFVLRSPRRLRVSSDKRVVKKRRQKNDTTVLFLKKKAQKGVAENSDKSGKKTSKKKKASN